MRAAEQGEIRAALADFKRTHARRDELVMAAIAAGIPIKEISRLSGLSRSVIYALLDREARTAEPDRER